MEKQITRVEDEAFEGFFRRHIFGLNLLPDDHPASRSISDPRIVFLRELSSQYTVAGVVNKDSSRAEHLTAFLPNGSTKQVANSYCADFIYSADTPEATGIYIPEFERSLFDLEAIEEIKREAVVFHILYSDGFALFVSPTSEESVIRLSYLLETSFDSGDQFLRETVSLYDVIITSKADGDFFSCFALTPEKFDILTSPLEVAVAAIRNMSWFRETVDKLEWDDHYSMCLIAQQTDLGSN